MSQQGTNKAVRLIFRYEGDRVELVAQQPLETVTQPSDEIDDVPSDAASDAVSDAPRRSGFWFQLEDAGGAALYRRVAQNPIRPDREVYAPEGETISRVPDAERKGVFTVVVPDVQGAERVTLQSDQPTHDMQGEADASETPRQMTTIASFKLDHT